MSTTGVDDRHVLITGGASGIALQTARTLHGQGARLTLIDVNGPGLEAVADELGASAQVADVTDGGAHLQRYPRLLHLAGAQEG